MTPDPPAVAIFRLDGMCCPSEGQLVDAVLQQQPDATGWTTNHVEGTVRVQLAAGADPQRVQAALATTGLGVTRVDDRTADARTPGPERRRSTVLLLTALVATVAGVIATLLGARSIAAPLYLSATVLGGVPTVRRAWVALRQRRVDMHVLMSIAVVGALFIGEWLEAAMVVLLFALANALEAFSLERARTAIGRLLVLTPRHATVRRDGADVTVPADAIQVGDLVVVKAGERVPVDGVILAGRSAMDQSAVTGESRPVTKTVDDPVFAGTLCTDGVLEVRATHRVADSTPARIRHMVEEAQATRAPVQRFVDRFAARYTPAVIGCAALVALLPPLLAGGEWAAWGYQALVLLVIACPCALVISTPVTLVSHLAAAARCGILIKGGVHLENLARVCSVVFDKTGTLTQGQPRVVHVAPLNGLTEREVLRYAAAVEARATHPLAPVICAAARSAGVEIPDAGETHTHPGQGLHATVEGRDVWVGTLAMAQGESERIRAAAAEVREHEAHGETVVVVGSGPEPYGVIALADAPRPEARETIRKLRAQGLHHLHMLTGDNRTVAEQLKRELGLDTAFAELLPEDKVAAVQRLLDAEHAVAMVGDGINDAPALATATVGIAMGAGGNDVALEAADVALLGDDLTAVPRAVALARSAMRIVHQNVALALGVKLVVFALALAGMATLWMAILADMGASLLVIGNALRPLTKPVR